MVVTEVHVDTEETLMAMEVIIHTVMPITVEAQAMVMAEAIATVVSQAMVQPMDPTTVGLCMELAATVVTCTVAQVDMVGGMMVATAVDEVTGTGTTRMANESRITDHHQGYLFNH